MHENELSELRRKLEEEEGRCADVVEENLGLKQEVADLHLEMEELHDQFREDEAIEFRELQKELESTAKSCRILQFKLRKAERRIDQLETERIQADGKARQQQQQGEAVRFQRPSADERQHVLELEDELRAAKDLNARLYDQIETVEEKRARYEQELDRVNDILTESENRRQVLQVELERLREQVTLACRRRRLCVYVTCLTVTYVIYIYIFDCNICYILVIFEWLVTEFKSINYEPLQGELNYCYTVVT